MKSYFSKIGRKKRGMMIDRNGNHTYRAVIDMVFIGSMEKSMESCQFHAYENEEENGSDIYFYAICHLLSQIYKTDDYLFASILNSSSVIS